MPAKTAPSNAKRFWKDPDDVLDYLNDWQNGDEPFLRPGDVINTSTWAVFNTLWVANTDLVINSSTHDNTTATVRLSAGLVGATYYVTNHIVTSEGLQKDETIQIICEEQ